MLRVARGRLGLAGFAAWVALAWASVGPTVNRQAVAAPAEVASPLTPLVPSNFYSVLNAGTSSTRVH